MRYVYAYVGGKPTGKVDPTGRLGWDTAGFAIIGAAANGISNGLNYSSQGCSFWKGFINGAAGGAVGGALINAVPQVPFIGIIAGAGLTEYLNQRQGVMTAPSANLPGPLQSYIFNVGLAGLFGSLGNMIDAVPSALFAIGAGSGTSAIVNAGGMLNGDAPPCQCK